MSEHKVKWHKYPEEKPPREDSYFISYKEGEIEYIADSFYSNGEFEDFQDCEVTAWTEHSEFDCRFPDECKACRAKEWCSKYEEYEEEA